MVEGVITEIDNAAEQETIDSTYINHEVFFDLAECEDDVAEGRRVSFQVRYYWEQPTAVNVSLLERSDEGSSIDKAESTASTSESTTDTVVYSAHEDPHPEEIRGQLRYCFACGLSLESYPSVTFCPNCGTDLSDVGT